jgi:hypothetical protein
VQIKLLFLFHFVFCLCFAEGGWIVKNSFVISGDRLNLRVVEQKLKNWGFEVEQLTESSYQITRSGLALKKLDFEDQLECWVLKNIIKNIEACSPNLVFFVNSEAVTQQDSLRPYQWGLNYISDGNWEELSEAYTGRRIIVAVTDTGIDFNHFDLAPNVFKNEGEIAENGLDDDENGFPDDRYGWNGVDNSGDVLDRHGHGTHVAGIIASSKNGIGTVGVAHEATILPIKVLNDRGYGTLDSIVRGLNYVKSLVLRGYQIKVLNASWGGGGYSEVLDRLFRELNDLGVLIVAAAGNSGLSNDENPFYPANYSASLSVASIDPSGYLSYFSNYGRSVAVAAPGFDILSTLPNNQFGFLSGTSMAAPFVSAAAAITFSLDPSFTPEMVKSRLFKTCKKFSSLKTKIRNGCVLALKSLIEDKEEYFEQPQRIVYRHSFFSENFAARLNDVPSERFENPDEGEILKHAIYGLYFGKPINFVTISSNFLIYFDRPRHIFDFLYPFTQDISSAISVAGRDWIAKYTKFATNDQKRATELILEGCLYENRENCLKVYVALHSQGGIQISFKMRRRTFEQLRAEGAKIDFINHEGRVVKSIAFSRSEGTIAFAPDKQENIVVNSFKLRKASQDKIISQLSGAGTGVLYARVRINNFQCKPRLRLPIIDGDGRKISYLSAQTKRSLIVRVKLSLHSLNFSQSNYLIFRGNKKLETNSQRLTQICRQITLD